MEYTDLRILIEGFYKKLGIDNKYQKDHIYLENAFFEINQLWDENFNKVSKVKSLIIAEAPLWGERKKYFYNPETTNTQFFYQNDLAFALNRPIMDKKELINSCNDIGLIIVDISPFALNLKDTHLNYRLLPTDEYKHLINSTINTYFKNKIEDIAKKKSENVKVAFRYARVRDAFKDSISKVLIDNGIIKPGEEIVEISQNGGGISRYKLEKLVNN